MKGGGVAQAEETLLANVWNSNFITLLPKIVISIKGQWLFLRNPRIEEGVTERRNYHESIVDSDN